MELRSVHELFLQVSAANPDKVAFRYKKEGRWIDVTWGRQRETVTALSRSLVALGVRKGDRVAILSQTRLEWLQCDSAIVGSGAVSVGIYPSNLGPDCAFILNHSGAEVLFVENDEQLEKILPLRAEIPGLRLIVSIDGATREADGVYGWDDFLEKGRSVPDSELEKIAGSLRPDDLACLVFTSGTTGLPKGAMISHGNLLFTCRSAAGCLDFDPSYETLLFLPLAHVFAKMIAYVCMERAVTVAFAENMTTLGADLREIRPHFIVSVPRIFEKVHEKVLTGVEEAGGLKQRLFNWAVDVGMRVSRLGLAKQRVPAWLALQHRLADRLVLGKVRAGLGGRIAWAASGAAPLNVSINEFFHACGIPIVEGFGMTENTSLSNANRLDHNKLGTVGPVAPGVEMKLAPDGEVLFRGDNVMQGYYRNPEATAEAIDADGWLHSGDIGEIDEDGFLKITDRKKDLIITAGGKNIAPQRIEKVMRSSRFIAQVVAYGDRRKYISALVTLAMPSIEQWAAANGLGSVGGEELAGHERVRALIEREIAERNEGLASYESIKKFRILPRDLSIEEGELTPSLKVKRKVVFQKYRDLLEQMYE